MIMHYNVNTIQVGVLGASGYAGRELCALVGRHPRFALAFATANEQRGQTVRLGGRDVTFTSSDDADLDGAALVFCALPHGTSLPWVERARAAGARVVDLSSDLRPGNGAPATAPRAVYGMPELGASTRSAIRAAGVVANPGCYPTSILLPLVPLVEQGLVRDGATIVANAASGVSEMTATLAGLGGDVDLVFTPHLLPVARGILATITVPLAEPLSDPIAFYRRVYANEPFIEVVEEQPALRDVVRRNVVRLSATMLAGTRTPTLLVTSALDNLVKGAAGQAVQNANLMLGLDECAGLVA
jgi:N-acetyl-gamma-glutamyl-phosphate reductase